jgi:hypothetical protein
MKSTTTVPKANLPHITAWLVRLTDDERSQKLAALVTFYQQQTGRPANVTAMCCAWRAAEFPERPVGRRDATGADRIYHVAKALLETWDALGMTVSNADTIRSFTNKRGQGNV